MNVVGYKEQFTSLLHDLLSPFYMNVVGYKDCPYEFGYIPEGWFYMNVVGYKVPQKEMRRPRRLGFI